MTDRSGMPYLDTLGRQLAAGKLGRRDFVRFATLLLNAPIHPSGFFFGHDVALQTA